MPNSTKVRLHGNNVRDVIIAHVISADAQIYIPTDAENPKDQLAACEAHGQLVKKFSCQFELTICAKHRRDMPASE